MHPMKLQQEQADQKATYIEPELIMDAAYLAVIKLNTTSTMFLVQMKTKYEITRKK